jgi:hypothetical protein
MVRNKRIFQKTPKGETYKEKVMQADLKRAVAWGIGLGIGFAIAGMALGLFKKL